MWSPGIAPALAGACRFALPAVLSTLLADQLLYPSGHLQGPASLIEYLLIEESRRKTDTLTSLALIAGGVAIGLFGAYFWKRPERYDRYFHQQSAWAFSEHTPRAAVRFGALATIVIGFAVCLWGLVELAA